MNLESKSRIKEQENYTLTKKIDDIRLKKETISDELVIITSRKNSIEDQLQESFWGDFLIGGLIVSGFFLVIEALDLKFPVNLIIGLIILIVGFLLVLVRYYIIRKKEKKVKERLDTLNYEENLYLGLQKFREGDNESAVSFWRVALSYNGDSTEIFNGIGAALSNNGHYLAAIPYFEKALRIDDSDPLIWINKGITKYQLNEKHMALICYNKAIEIEPSNLTAWKRKAGILKELGENEQAIEAYDKVLNINPNDTDALFDKGNTLYHMGIMDQAIDNLRQVIEINPNDKEALSLLGAYYLINQDPQESERFINRSLELDENYINALNNKASLLIFYERLDEALDLVEKILNIDENHNEALVNKGWIIFKKGEDRDEALSWIDKALINDPNLLIALFNKASILSIENEIESSLSLIRRILELDNKYLTKILMDPFFKNSRNSPKFEQIIQEYKNSL